MKHILYFHIYKGDSQYIAEGIDVPVVTQAKTLDNLMDNIKEAVALHLEGEDLNELGVAPFALILANMEMPLREYV
ncbi:MAG: type II toxin-antitoxin system HicB family antitoxin [Candidatus Jacksonbacteria bacterium]|nr:type II toxin-antitoxin system HicB family antitoxin [Candidatus Jacksonbacteria bacterium]